MSTSSLRVPAGHGSVVVAPSSVTDSAAPGPAAAGVPIQDPVRRVPVRRPPDCDRRGLARVRRTRQRVAPGHGASDARRHAHRDELPRAVAEPLRQRRRHPEYQRARVVGLADHLRDGHLVKLTHCLPLASGTPLRRLLPTSFVPRSSVQSAPAPLRLALHGRRHLEPSGGHRRIDAVPQARSPRPAGSQARRNPRTSRRHAKPGRQSGPVAAARWPPTAAGTRSA
jgi:hypothetical protein